MKSTILKISARRALCIALVLAPMPAVKVNAQAAPPASYGTRQSPVDIIEPVRIDRDAPKFGDTRALKTPLTFTLKNTTGSKWCPKGTCTGIVDQRWGSLKAYPPDASAPHIVFGGLGYTLKEFHFHIPAEHLVNSRDTAMEVHYVFAKDGGLPCSSGEYMVIGQRIVRGKNKNDELEKIFGPDVKLPVRYTPPPYTEVENFIIDNVVGDLHIQSSYRYDGSLTTPAELGCDDPPGNPDQQLASGYLPEVVSWVLLERPVEMSREQIERYAKLFPNGDARDPQELYQAVKKAVPGK